ncbi:MAG: hypothetical protein HOL85_03640 [Rhodospirillaceae bacterium]|nr:hypothetical protein [Rhodospirillaceae bacterium]
MTLASLLATSPGKVACRAWKLSDTLGPFAVAVVAGGKAATLVVGTLGAGGAAFGFFIRAGMVFAGAAFLGAVGGGGAITATLGLAGIIGADVRAALGFAGSPGTIFLVALAFRWTGCFATASTGAAAGIAAGAVRIAGFMVGMLAGRGAGLAIAPPCDRSRGLNEPDSRVNGNFPP